MVTGASPAGVWATWSSPPATARTDAGFLGVVDALVGFNIIADPLGGTITLTIVIALMSIFEGVYGLAIGFFVGLQPPRAGITRIALGCRPARFL